MLPPRHFVLFVTGVPASGKSTVACELAKALPGFALLQKDVIKETLFEALSPEERQTPESSRRLSDVSVRLLWSLAPGFPRVILEANFRTLNPAERENFQRLAAEKLEIHCRCAPAEAARRFARRASARHPAHTLQSLSPELLAESDTPFGVAPVIEVDTTLPLNMEEVLRRVRAHWPEL